jgi:hypothetical protein
MHCPPTGASPASSRAICQWPVASGWLPWLVWRMCPHVLAWRACEYGAMVGLRSPYLALPGYVTSRSRAYQRPTASTLWTCYGQRGRVHGCTVVRVTQVRVSHVIGHSRRVGVKGDWDTIMPQRAKELLTCQFGSLVGGLWRHFAVWRRVKRVGLLSLWPVACGLAGYGWMT